ncbi:hypothetical protein C0Q70_08179 [Pomacea canaliculata]|uniref:Uncharacterized protein n=1 Tax=Pomacea canaliculata TaxID=400727 RepID=A0A2T7PH35_POMCA|nr:hypothetical protein C0Q70_08179 [Pomacea canaliculata]
MVLALHFTRGSLVAVGAGQCSEDEVKLSLDTMNTNLTLAAATGYRHSSDDIIKLCREYWSREGIFASCRPHRIKSIAKFARDVKNKLQSFCEKECIGFITFNDCLGTIYNTNLTSPPYDSSTKHCKLYQEVVRDCVDDSQDCKIREPLFLAILTSAFREHLYEEGCVPRPVTASVSVESTTNLPTYHPTTVGPSSVATSSSPPGLCNLARARSCVPRSSPTMRHVSTGPCHATPAPETKSGSRLAECLRVSMSRSSSSPSFLGIMRREIQLDFRLRLHLPAGVERHFLSGRSRGRRA